MTVCARVRPHEVGETVAFSSFALVVAAAGLRTITSYERYSEAEAAVDRLSDRRFPVQHVTIIASDLRFVERVTGRLNAGKAADATHSAWSAA